MTKDLWGDLPDLSSLRTPIELMAEQATLITAKTKGVLDSWVVVTKGAVNYLDMGSDGPWKDMPAQDRRVAELVISAPFLQKYELTVVRVRFHPALAYPVEVSATLDATKAICENEADFEVILGKVLGSERVRTAVGTLIKQSHEHQ